MSSDFIPPNEDLLADVDMADVRYESSVCEIEGVVSGSSQGGWRRSDSYDVHNFSFSAWRFPGQPIQNKKLTVLRPVASDGDKFSEYPKLSIHRIKVLLSSDHTRAVFAGSSNVGPNKDQLQEIAEELSKPVVIHTERFGDLKLDLSIDWFVGEATWNSQLIRMNFPADETDDVSAGLKIASQLWDKQAQWKEKVESFAVEKLLHLKNETWLEEGEVPLSPEKFKAQMKIHSITISSDGSIEFWYDDGDLFWGHLIRISGSIDEGLKQADVQG